MLSSALALSSPEATTVVSPYPAPIELVIEVRDLAGVPQGIMRDTKAEVEHTFLAVGVRIRWADLGRTPRDEPAPLRLFVVVSRQGGDQPVWQRDGTAIYYVTESGESYRVAVRMDVGRLQLGPAERTRIPRFEERHFGTEYDVSADGSRWFIPRRSEGRASKDMTIVIGWRALLP